MEFGREGVVDLLRLERRVAGGGGVGIRVGPWTGIVGWSGREGGSAVDVGVEGGGGRGWEGVPLRAVRLLL